MVTNWATSFLHYKNTGFRRFVGAQLSFFCVQLFANFLKIAFFEKRVQKLGFSNFCVLSSFFQNYFLGLLKHYNNRGFSKILCFLLLKEKKKTQKIDNWNL